MKDFAPVHHFSHGSGKATIEAWKDLVRVTRVNWVLSDGVGLELLITSRISLFRITGF
ncbi:9110_t:CDS:2, partial [Ambispora leptoticha]